MIAILDYDAGNIRSVEKALDYIGEAAVLTRNPAEITRADKVILPGVGSFGDAMAHLKHYGLDAVIREIVKEGKPFLGICLGLQLLFQESEESPGVRGLGILPGSIVRIPDSPQKKIPHIGWNSLELKHSGRLFKNIEEGTHVYFVHSYYLQAQEEETVKATTEYGVSMDVSVEKDNVFACQFHPEKSGQAGLQILRNFAEL